MSLYVKDDWTTKVNCISEYIWSKNIPLETRNKYDNLGESKNKWRKSQKKLTVVRAIDDKKHPACGQHGLFALKKISAQTFICDYIGFIETFDKESKTSDYIIHFVDNLSIDAETQGNEARFINDFRGICQKPNAKFETYWVNGTNNNKNNQLRMGVFSMSQPIRANQEILVSYGKGFWKARTKA